MQKVFVDEILDKSLNIEFLNQYFDGSNYELNFLFKSDFNNAKHLRDAIINIFTIIGIEPIWKNRFVLIIDELNNNAIEYGSKKDDINSMRIKIYKFNNAFHINIEVEDCGNGTKHKTANQMEELRNTRLGNGFDNHNSIRGRGLFMIITRLVDELYFKDSDKGGLIVGINKKIEIKE